MPAQGHAPLQANNARSEGLNGKPNDDRRRVCTRPRLVCPRTVGVPALCLGLSMLPVKVRIVLSRRSSKSQVALCCAGARKPGAS
ncbi:hypothetical protein HaLaN_01357 [Haematococcus lacustris]|uniref:Uncharacterized protein n=1 Tax=Haematococcus lacustris TaxID=44745 RepID=A0A699Y932_HAELA|nr:hypothetical protein HaLaN_01357 [Haematococcus lacustris]